ncbi:MAG: hypothetical protein ACK5LM_01310 [Lactovum sp.]
MDSEENYLFLNNEIDRAEKEYLNQNEEEDSYLEESKEGYLDKIFSFFKKKEDLESFEDIVESEREKILEDKKEPENILEYRSEQILETEKEELGEEFIEESTFTQLKSQIFEKFQDFSFFSKEKAKENEEFLEESSSYKTPILEKISAILQNLHWSALFIEEKIEEEYEDKKIKGLTVVPAKKEELKIQKEEFNSKEIKAPRGLKEAQVKLIQKEDFNSKDIKEPRELKEAQVKLIQKEDFNLKDIKDTKNIKTLEDSLELKKKVDIKEVSKEFKSIEKENVEFESKKEIKEIVKVRKKQIVSQNLITEKIKENKEIIAANQKNRLKKQKQEKLEEKINRSLEKEPQKIYQKVELKSAMVKKREAAQLEKDKKLLSQVQHLKLTENKNFENPKEKASYKNLIENLENLLNDIE